VQGADLWCDAKRVVALETLAACLDGHVTGKRPVRDSRRNVIPKYQASNWIGSVSAVLPRAEVVQRGQLALRLILKIVLAPLVPPALVVR